MSIKINPIQSNDNREWNLDIDYVYVYKHYPWKPQTHTHTARITCPDKQGDPKLSTLNMSLQGCKSSCVILDAELSLAEWWSLGYLRWSLILLFSGEAPRVWTLLSHLFCCWVNGIFMVGFRFPGEDRTTFKRGLGSLGVSNLLASTFSKHQHWHSGYFTLTGPVYKSGELHL